MPPGKKIFLGFVFLIFLIFAIVVLYLFFQTPNFFSDASFVSQTKSQPKTLITRETSNFEIKKLAVVPDLRQTAIPLPVADSNLAKKLKLSGNALLFTTNPNDTTGRTMLVDDEQKIHKNVMGLGGVRQKFEARVSGKMAEKSGISRVSGVFSSWMRTYNSRDLYLILSDPQTKREFAVRTLFQKGGCFAASDELGLTSLVVQNINTKATNGDLSELGVVSAWSESDLAKIIQPGDFLVAYPRLYPKSTRTTHNLLAVSDYENGVLCADSLILSRFGGKEEIEKEIGKKIPLSPNTPMFERVLKLYGKNSK